MKYSKDIAIFGVAQSSFAFDVLSPWKYTESSINNNNNSKSTVKFFFSFTRDLSSMVINVCSEMRTLGFLNKI